MGKAVDEAQAEMAASSVTTQTGTDGPDGLGGTDGDDLVFGLGGDDGLFVSDGTDRLNGGDGFDTLWFWPVLPNESFGASILDPFDTPVSFQLTTDR